MSKLRMAYADPPYFRQGKKHYGDRHPRAAAYDQLDTHALLIGRLCAQFPDGWALSASSPSLRFILPLCPPGTRVAAWVKPFASFKPFVNPAYAWEPVLFLKGRRRDRRERTVRDWVSCSATIKRGLPGAKPAEFCFWLFELLGLQPGDTLVDLFPGTRAVGRAFRAYCRDRSIDGGRGPGRFPRFAARFT
jgi:hypothetical protein